MLAAVGEQSDKPLVSTFLGREGVPELLRVPDLAGHTAGRGSVPSYPAVEAAVRALARVVEYAAWLQRHDDSVAVLEDIDNESAKRQVNEILMHSPRRARADRRRSCTTCSRSYGIDLWKRIHVGHGRRGARRRRASSAGTWCSRRPRSACASDPTRRTCGATSTRPRTCATPGSSLMEIITDAADAEFVVQRTAAPGVPVAIARARGPAVRAGPLVRRLGCPHRARRRPRLPDPARSALSMPPRWCAPSRPRRCSSATAAASRSTSARSRT